jgi:hypothetical protein
MSNKIYFWEDKTTGDNKYASAISFTSDEMMLKVRFGDLAQFLLSHNKTMSYEDIILSEESFSLMEKVLQSFQRDSERTFFTVDVSNRSYLKMMAFLENIVFKNVAFPKDKRLELLDLVYDNIDESVIKNIHNPKGTDFQVICEAIINVVGTIAPDCSEVVSHNIGNIDRSIVIPEVLLSDLFFEMTILMAWLVNHKKHIRKENAYNIVLFTDVEQAMQAILGVVQRNRSVEFGGEIHLEHESGNEIEKAVGLFFSIISQLLHSVLNRDDKDMNGINSQLVNKENILLGDLWKTFQKEGSIWMTSPKKNKKLMEYL